MFEHPVGDQLRVLTPFDPTHEHELVATQAGDGVAEANRALEPAGEGDEYAITDVVAQGVVDVLEPVEVEEQHGDGLAAELGVGEGGFEPFEEDLAVDEPGEWIVAGLVRELLHGSGVGDRDRREVRRQHGGALLVGRREPPSVGIERDVTEHCTGLGVDDLLAPTGR